MALTRERMVDRMLAGDAAYNGRFFTGVLTTGIYCLPSCHARKPKPENVRFFSSTTEAKAAGLRPCKLCKPDEFERGINPDLERLETLAKRIRSNPGSYRTIEQMAGELCASVSVLNEQFREHYQTPPGSFLLHARIDAACELLICSPQDASQVGYDVGFESTSGFYEAFRRLIGMTPAAYRGLRENTTAFEIQLPAEYPLDAMKDVLARDPLSISERLDRNLYAMAFMRDGAAQLATLDLECRTVRCTVSSSGVALEAYRRAARVLNLRQEPKPFERHARTIGFERLFAGREGMRIPQTPSLFEGIIWVVLGQQVNFRFAATLRRRLTERVGTPIGGLMTEPSPEDLDSLRREELLEMQFSRQKADYLLGIVQSIADKKLDLEALSNGSATAARKRFTGIRGLGVWSVNYLMMRSMNFGDCIPLGDTGISSGVKNLYGLDHRPDAKECDELMSRFAPHRSLACYHLWRGFSPAAAGVLGASK